MSPLRAFRVKLDADGCICGIWIDSRYFEFWPGVGSLRDVTLGRKRAKHLGGNLIKQLNGRAA